MTLTSRKLNAIARHTNHGPKTVTDIIQTLYRHIDVEGLTAKQIGQIVNAMYESKEIGYNEAYEEFHE